MKDRVVYLGDYNNIKKDELIYKSIKYLKENKGDRFNYILPNGILLKDYRKAMIEEVGQTFNINLLTFDDIVDNLIEDDFYVDIDKETKEVLLTEILVRLNGEGKLNYYKDISGKRGFVRILGSIIGEIKRSLITPEDYLHKCPETLFYEEIGWIYKEYEKQLSRHKLIDREGSFFKSFERLKGNNDYFADLDFIIIDGFFDFRPQEIKLLREIEKTDCDIYINMPFNRDESFHTFRKTLDTLVELGFKVEDLEKEKASYFEELANTIFNEESRSIRTNPNINMIRSANSYLEMKKIGEEIKRHHLEGIDLNDMAIILVDSGEYENLMFQVFEEERIPCALNKEISLRKLPLIKEIFKILESSKSGGDKKSTINRMKSNYFSLCASKERESIEYILRRVHFDSISELLEDDILKSVYDEKLVENILRNLEEENEEFPNRGSLEEYIDAIAKIINSYNIEENIIKNYELNKDYHLIHRDLACFNQFKEVLNKLEKLKIVLDYKISIDEFIDLLGDHLGDESILEVQGNDNGVNVLRPVTARGHEFELVFIVGLSQGKYPNVMNENFFFRDDNYRELKNIGIDVKNYYDKLDKESIMFTTMISACSNILYLSYSENSMGDEKDIPSMFLDEVLEVLDGEELEEKLNLIPIDIDYLFKAEPSKLTTKEDLGKYLINGYYRGEYSREQFGIYNNIDPFILKEINDKMLSEVERAKPEFTEYSGKIGDLDTREDISKLHEDKLYSISYLESYGKCPYYFLLNNVLEVEEMERDISDFSPLDRGIIIHSALNIYYSKYMEEIKNHILGEKNFLVDETYEDLIQIMNEDIMERGTNIESKIWKMRIESNADNIMELVKSDLERLSSLEKKAIPMDLELEFGKTIPFDLEAEGMKIPLTGVIDRVDKYVDEDKYIIIDYKNTDYSVKDIDDMRSGLSLQLPVYILSQKDKRVVAGMYGIVSKGEFQLKIGDVDENHLMSKRNKGAITRVEIEELLEMTKDSIVSYIDSIHQGDFSVDPKECSPYCIYKDICRYKEVLKID